MDRRSRLFAALGVMLTASLGAAACGSSSSKASVSASTTTVASSAATTAPSSGGTAAPTTGGTAAPASGVKATGSPIDVGFATGETGPFGFPGVTQAGQAAAAYFNAQKGGLNGHVIKLVTCDMKEDAQSAQECGQKFSADHNMPFAIVGIAIVAQPFVAAMNAAGKPIVFGFEVSPDQETAKNSFDYILSNTNYVAAQATELKGLHPKSIAVLYTETPAGTPQQNELVNDLKGAGIKLKLSGIAQGSSDYTSALVASGAKTADAVFIDVPNCKLAAQSMQQLGIHPKYYYTYTGCLDLPTLTANPSLFNGWLDVTGAKIPVPYSPDPDVQLMLQSWSKYGPGGAIPTYAEVGWSAADNAFTALEGVTDLTSATAATAFHNFKGPSSMAGASVSCPASPATPANCATEPVLYKIENGKFIEQQT
jgi:branched-chain amino acid transport system substrate-binding protein